MSAIYGNIYHPYTPMLAYIPYMDPMGMWIYMEHRPQITIIQGIHEKQCGDALLHVVESVLKQINTPICSMYGIYSPTFGWFLG